MVSWIRYEPLTKGSDYTYPGWANGIGWIIAMTAILATPFMAIVQLVQKIFFEYKDLKFKEVRIKLYIAFNFCLFKISGKGSLPPKNPVLIWFLLIFFIRPGFGPVTTFCTTRRSGAGTPTAPDAATTSLPTGRRPAAMTARKEMPMADSITTPWKMTRERRRCRWNKETRLSQFQKNSPS